MEPWKDDCVVDFFEKRKSPITYVPKLHVQTLKEISFKLDISDFKQPCYLYNCPYWQCYVLPEPCTLRKEQKVKNLPPICVLEII